MSTYYHSLCLEIPNDDKKIIRRAITDYDETLISLMEKYRKCADTKDLQIFMRKYIQRVKAKQAENNLHTVYTEKILRNSSVRHISSRCNTLIGDNSRPRLQMVGGRSPSNTNLNANSRLLASSIVSERVGSTTSFYNN
jgi:hypothetical protein